MSILVRAAILGGLAYVVSRAIKSSQELSYTSDAPRLARADIDDLDDTYPSSDARSTSNR